MKTSTKSTMIRLGAVLVALMLVLSVSLISRNNSLRATDEVAEVTVKEAPDEVIAEAPVEAPAEAPAEQGAVAQEEIAIGDITEDEKVVVISGVAGEEEAADDPAELPEDGELPEDAEEPEEGEEEEVERSVRVWYEYEGEPYLGMTMKVNSEVKGFGPDAAYQWEHSADGKNWVAENGATHSSVTYTLDETTCFYYWRLVVSE